MINKNQRILNVLFDAARTHEPAANARLAAGVLYKNNMISIGINQLKSHPFQKKWGKNKDSIYLHAEIHAIFNSLRIVEPDFLKKCSLWICRVKANDSFGLAKPCEGCMKAINAFGIKNIYYTTNEEHVESIHY